MDTAKKTNAFRLYDFESDDRWKEFKLRVDISGSDYNNKLLKLKAKWYKREVDPDFEFSWLQEHGTRPTQQETTTTKNSEPTNESTTSTPTRATNQAGEASPMRTSDPFLIVLHLGILVLGAWCVLPMSPPQIQSYFLQLVIVIAILKAMQNHSRPKLRPFSELQRWLAQVMATTDSQYGFMALLFIRNVPTRLLFIPSTVLAAYHISSYLNGRIAHMRIWIQYGKKLHEKLAQHQHIALQINAVCEIGVGLILILQLVRSFQMIVSAFLYWQWLRLRYHSIDAAAYHRQVTCLYKCYIQLYCVPRLGQILEEDVSHFSKQSLS